MTCMNKNIYTSERVHLVEGLSYILYKGCRKHSTFGCIPKTLQMDIKSYLWIIASRTNCSNESLVLSLVYIDRLCEKSSLITITPHNVYYWVLISVLLAIKFHDDHIYSNAVYSKMGGVSLKNLNDLERTFLREIKFELFVSAGVYTKYFRKLTKAADRVFSKQAKPKIQTATHTQNIRKQLYAKSLPVQSIFVWKSQSRASTNHKPKNRQPYGNIFVNQYLMIQLRNPNDTYKNYAYSGVLQPSFQDTQIYSNNFYSTVHHQCAVSTQHTQYN